MHHLRVSEGITDLGAIEKVKHTEVGLLVFLLSILKPVNISTMCLCPDMLLRIALSW